MFEDGDSVICRSVCLSVTIVNHAKTAEPIEIPFGMWTRVGPVNYVLDRSPDLPRVGVFLRGNDVGISPHAED